MRTFCPGLLPDASDVRGVRALGALLHVELDGLALVQVAESAPLDGREVNYPAASGGACPSPRGEVETIGPLTRALARMFRAAV